MEEMRFESKYRDKFVTRTINHAQPRPSWWRVRIEELVEEMKKVFYKQLLTYLRLMTLNVGILVNFNTDNILESIDRVVN